MPPSEAALDEAAEILARAKRPMLWLGNGAKAAGAEAMALLALGFGAVSSWNGRGIIPEDHPMTLGGLHGNGAPRVQEVYKSCDAMLVVGSRLRPLGALLGAVLITQLPEWFRDLRDVYLLAYGVILLLVIVLLRMARVVPP